MTQTTYPLRPFLPADTMALRELFAQSIEELTQDDYDEEQRAAWAVEAEDAEAFAKRLASMTTIVIQQGGDHLGFAALKDNKAIDMLFVIPTMPAKVSARRCATRSKELRRRAGRTRSRSMPANRQWRFMKRAAIKPCSAIRCRAATSG